jgi:hypothetical protein
MCFRQITWYKPNTVIVDITQCKAYQQIQRVARN